MKRRPGGLKVVVWSLAILMQIIFWLFAYDLATAFLPYWKTVATLISAAVVLYIVNKPDNPAYKMSWIILVLVAPVVGGVGYILLAENKTRRKFIQRASQYRKDTKQYVPKDDDVQRELKNISQDASIQSMYISKTAGYPVYKDTKVEYFVQGEDNFESLMEKLAQAKHFIFMEYYIIKPGYMWESILDILKQKAKLGVDVRLIYDGFGCSLNIGNGFEQEMHRYGIRAVAFNPMVPVINLRQNHRDHRKITVIDGYVGFTGGINLADEYINRNQRFGHWKDTGVMLLGPAVWNLTLMFLQNWHMATGESEDYRGYVADKYVEEMSCLKKNSFALESGFVQPYGNTPVDTEIVGENIYLNLINRAKRYVYITTPYLILDNEMLTSLCLAAKSGIDVRIITPGIPDKKLVFLVTQSYYLPLMKAGVRIYQYTPGFIHAKTVVVDDKIATIGTVNFDYRSFYLQFECGVWLSQNSVIYEMRDDFARTVETCYEITLTEMKEKKRWKLFWQSMLRLAAPLM